MGYKPIPEYLIPAIASFVVLLMLNQWGGKLAARGGAYAAGVQVATALTAASVVGGVANLPLIDSIRDLISDLFNLIGQNIGGVFGWSAQAIVFVLALGATYMAWKKYDEGKDGKSLLIFGMLVLVSVTFVPWIGEVLVWWANNFVALLWGILIGAIDLVAQRRFS